jgi:hypothetical protein
MKTEQNSINEISWTWADQISSYRFWGLFLFFGFLLIPNVISINLIQIIRMEFNLSYVDISTIYGFKTFGLFLGLWLAWFMVRMKNHYLLYLFSSFAIGGLILILFIPSTITLSISLFLIGLSSGAITLSIPAIISGGKGGSEMFIVSFGIITFFELTIRNSTQLLVGITGDMGGNKAIILIGLASAIVGSILLIPAKTNLFNTNPPKREFALTPKFRNPSEVVLLCLIPLYNIYYIIYLSYRYHGEVNSINPTQKILSPRAAAWCICLIPFLYPIITSSLNDSLTPKLLINNTPKYNKTWVIILWAFIFLPVSFALIQSNMNKLINTKVN